MWKVGGLVFTHAQLVQLCKHLRPEREELADNAGFVYSTANRFAWDRKSEFIAVDVMKPNGHRTTKFLLRMRYSNPSETETRTRFEKFEEGPKESRIRKWFTAHGIKGPLPFDTFMIAD